jgi:hypothetical protein
MDIYIYTHIMATNKEIKEMREAMRSMAEAICTAEGDDDEGDDAGAGVDPMDIDNTPPATSTRQYQQGVVRQPPPESQQERARLGMIKKNIGHLNKYLH